MRNWNTTRELQTSWLRLDCEPTYEELKLVRSRESVGQCLDCEPTYEELKYVSKFILLKTSFNCEPTYEELKSSTSTSTLLTSPHCEPTYEELKSHPLHICRRIVFQLRAYLWGIEICICLPCFRCPGDCEPTHEELKSSPFCSFTLCVWIASLPMRNWNDRLIMKEIDTLEIASLPMRNWNAFVTKKSLPAKWIASLPMRNWNLFARPRTPHTLHPLRAYLWGIEILKKSINWTSVNDCEPTYEELKYFSGEFKILPWDDCEPTYEELKSICSCLLNLYGIPIASLPMRNWNEGDEGREVVWGVIASLPMRNRNQYALACWTCTVSRLRAYLWGIKIRLCLCSLTKFECIASLPMRNWNAKQSIKSELLDLHCEPTYEELK